MRLQASTLDTMDCTEHNGAWRSVVHVVAAGAQYFGGWEKKLPPLTPAPPSPTPPPHVGDGKEGGLTLGDHEDRGQAVGLLLLAPAEGRAGASPPSRKDVASLPGRTGSGS